MGRLRLLIAPNAFKGAADAHEVARALAAGFRQSKLLADITCTPIADGGDGTLYIVTQALQGEVVERTVKDPLGREITARLGLISSKSMAVIEMADASGLKLLADEERDVMRGSSYGTGQLIGEAIQLGAREVVLCIGGSATVDGGMGILAALGFVFKDKSGELLTPCGASLGQIAEVIPPEAPLACSITVLCDVTNPLLGKTGAAAVYGPQKGASPDDVAVLDSGLAHWAALIQQHKNADVNALVGGGAAGGVSAGLAGWLGAVLKPGAAFVLDLLGMDTLVRQADLVITAEGSLDEQTAEGKAPFVLLRLAKKYDKAIIGLGGRVPATLSSGALNEFEALLAIGSEPEPLQAAMAHTLANLERTALQLGNLLAIQQGLKA